MDKYRKVCSLEVGVCVCTHVCVGRNLSCSKSETIKSTSWGCQIKQDAQLNQIADEQ